VWRDRIVSGYLAQELNEAEVPYVRSDRPWGPLVTVTQVVTVTTCTVVVVALTAMAWAEAGPVVALLCTGGLVLLAAGIWAGEDRGAK